MAGPCPDCPRACPSRGAASYCGTDRPGRVLWRGVTYAEEHEIAPTFEVFLTGCSLRCRFCYVPEALTQPNASPWLSPSELVAELTAPTTPPFRAVAFVGGDPTVNRPWLEDAAAAVRGALPGMPLVLNTNLFIPQAQIPFYAARFDLVVGDLHFWEPACAGELAGARTYPEVGRRAAEALAAAGVPLILRILVLPGHLSCCAAPTARWAASLKGDVKVRVMTHYAPWGKAAHHPVIGRTLSPKERALAASLLPPGARGVEAGPVSVPRRGPGAVDAPAWVEVDRAGRQLVPFITGDLLPLAAEIDPALGAHLIYVDGDAG